MNPTEGPRRARAGLRSATDTTHDRRDFEARGRGMSVREVPQRAKAKARTETERVVESESTLGRLQARGERLLEWFPELRKTWERDAEPALEALFAQIQALGGQVSRRAQATRRDLEERAERLLTDLEHQAVRGLGPILSRANLASGTEVSGLDTRLTELEQRMDAASAERDQLSSRLGGVEASLPSRVASIESALRDARVEATERLREMAVRLAANDDLHGEITRVHGQLDALSKDQVARSLELGKLHDRLVRLEMRMGDVLKEQSTHGATQQVVARKLGEVEHTVANAAHALDEHRAHREQLATEGRATDARLTALMSARNADHDELSRLTDALVGIQQILRQVDLRLGDLGERYAGVREDLAGLSARVSHLELATTPPVSGSRLAGRSEGH